MMRANGAKGSKRLHEIAKGAELDMSADEAMALAQGLVDALTDLTGHEFTASSAGGAPDMDMPGDEG
ncbi:MAG: hypothetical protein VX075_05760, partial [Pseudomonadota bacterium]|nr:hypothetical protein [Pseudomonadota bacterium]